MKNHLYLILLILLQVGCESQPTVLIPTDNYPIANERVQSKNNTTYYINPNSGSDENSGISKDSPWKTFVNLNQLVLSKGNRVEVLEPGEFRESLFFIGEGTVESPITIQFASGKYDFYPEHGFKRKIHISNTNDAPDSLKTIAFYFKDSKNVNVKGNGAEINFRGKVIETNLSNCENISIERFKFDYERPTISEMIVLNLTDTFADILIHKDSKYKIEDSILVWLGEGWKHNAQDYWQAFDKVEEKVSRKFMAAKKMRFSELSKDNVRIHFDENPGFIKGLTYQTRNTFRDYVGVFIEESKNVSLKNLTIYFMHGMGIVSQHSENITIDSLTVSPREGSGRTCAAWADILHFSGCKGDVLVSNSFLSAANDDAINVHGTHLRITEKTADRKIKVSFMHPQAFGFNTYFIGDSIEFIGGTNLLPYAKNSIVHIERINYKELELTLGQDITDSIQTNDVIENITWTPNVTIRNNKMTYIPTRGILVTTRGKVLIENNEFVNTHMSGVLIANDAASWYESGYVRDVTIKSNEFKYCGTPIIKIHPENSEIIEGRPVHKNIKIIENQFILKKGLILSAKSTGNIKFFNNTIQSDNELNIDNLIELETCEDVEISVGDL